ncbi:hypothetical protein ACFL5V_06690 [Fibrobacterota bacterium]
MRKNIPECTPNLGGGYSTGNSHGRSNNELARIYLHKMYEKAVRFGVPFKTAGSGRNGQWKVPVKLKNSFNRLTKFYDAYPGLKEKHKVLRAHERHLEILKDELPKRMARETHYAFGVKPNVGAMVKQKLDKFNKLRVLALKDLIRKEVFKNDVNQETAFYSCFHEFWKKYIHISHYPYNKGPGMDAQKQEINHDLWPFSSKAFGDKNPRYYCGLKRWVKRQVYHSKAVGKKDMNTLKNRDSLCCHLKFLVKGKGLPNPMPLPGGGYVRVWDDDVFINDKLGAADLQKDGTARVFCFDINDDMDLFFTLHCKNVKVGGKKLPREWDSRKHKCMKKGSSLVKGAMENFKGKVIGSVEDPLTLYVEV